MSRQKGWCFTSFDIQNEPVFRQEVYEFLIFGRETCPSTSREHWQGFVYLKKRNRFAAVKKYIGPAHIEPSRGTPEEAAAYCRKDGNFKEFGSLPRTTVGSNKFAAVLVAAENGDISTIKDHHPGIYLRYKTNILSSIKFDVEELDSSCGVWIAGPPRCGKDASVRKIGNIYNKNLNKWWDGYRNEPNVLLSDIEPSHAPWLGYFLKIWTDRYPFNAEIKGSSMMIRPKKIFCTSNFLLSDVFNGKVLEALEARFNVYDMFTDNVYKRAVKPVCYSVYEKLVEHGDVQETVPEEVAQKENEPPAETAEEAYSSAEEFTISKNDAKKRFVAHSDHTLGKARKTGKLR